MIRARGDKRRRLVRPVWWLAALILATIAVWQRYAVVQYGADVERLQADVVELQRARDLLLVETGRLSARERIEEIAKSKLGLTPTDRSRIRKIELKNAGRPAGNAL